MPRPSSKQVRRLSIQKKRPGFDPLPILIAAFAILFATGAFAQVHHPFAIGAGEGAVGHQTGLGAWLLAQESGFYRRLTSIVRQVAAGPAAVLTLIALSFGYGVFHAAGPGHGKAVIASYIVSNEVALRRGLVIALLAAILQAVVAIFLVGVAAFVFNATALRMTAAAGLLELASYGGIVLLGLVLVWRKGRAVVARLAPSPRFILAGARSTMAFETRHVLQTGLLETGLRQTSRFSADDGLKPHGHGPGCGHVHMPDPVALTAARFDWRAAGLTIVTAGARPCSGAILVLVFAVAQGVFWAGITSAVAMAMGTAITTGALAVMAVFAKGLALRLSGDGAPRAALVGQLVELAAALCVLVFGILLLTAALAGSSVRA